MAAQAAKNPTPDGNDQRHQPTFVACWSHSASSCVQHDGRLRVKKHRSVRRYQLIYLFGFDCLAAVLWPNHQVDSKRQFISPRNLVWISCRTGSCLIIQSRLPCGANCTRTGESRWVASCHRF